MPKPKAKCVQCDRRFVGCHSVCHYYKEFKDEMVIFNQNRRFETIKNRPVYGRDYSR